MAVSFGTGWVGSVVIRGGHSVRTSLRDSVTVGSATKKQLTTAADSQSSAIINDTYSRIVGDVVGLDRRVDITTVDVVTWKDWWL